MYIKKAVIPYYLLKKEEKIYSLESNNTVYETKMTSNTVPKPYVASSSSVYSTTYPAWKAYNGDKTGIEHRLTPNGTPFG